MLNRVWSEEILKYETNQAWHKRSGTLQCALISHNIKTTHKQSVWQLPFNYLFPVQRSAGKLGHDVHVNVTWIRDSLWTILVLIGVQFFKSFSRSLQNSQDSVVVWGFISRVLSCFVLLSADWSAITVNAHGVKTSDYIVAYCFRSHPCTIQVRLLNLDKGALIKPSNALDRNSTVQEWDGKEVPAPHHCPCPSARHHRTPSEFPHSCPDRSELVSVTWEQLIRHHQTCGCNVLADWCIIEVSHPNKQWS